MDSVKVDVDPPVVALLETVWTGMKDRLGEAAKAAAPDLRSSHVRVLSMTSPQGMRVGELAARAGMTSQALGEFVVTLERAGYLVAGPDPADRRARLVRPTPKGLRVRDEMLAALERLESDWRNQLGPHRWGQFRKALASLGQHLHKTEGPDRATGGAVGRR